MAHIYKQIRSFYKWYYGLISLPFLGLTVLYISASADQQKGLVLYDQCKDSYQSGNFHDAKSLCEDAISQLCRSHIFQKTNCDVIGSEINAILSSETMLQGLDGKVFYNDTFITGKELNDIKKVNELYAIANELFNNSNWQLAEEKYSEAALLIKHVSIHIEAQVIQTIDHNLLISQIYKNSEKGESLLAEGDYDNSMTFFKNALIISSKLPKELRYSYIFKLNNHITNVSYLKYSDAGNQAMFAGKYADATFNYRQALKVVDSSPVNIPTETKNSLFKSLAKAEVLESIEQAKLANTNNKPEVIVEKYENILEVINNNRTWLKNSSFLQLEQEIKRVVLFGMIEQFKDIATLQKNNSNYTKALKFNKQIIRQIEAYEFSDDLELKNIFADTQKEISELEQLIAIDKRLQFLEINYKDIFTETYSEIDIENLSNPKAFFYKINGEEEMYRLKCLEDFKGRKINLVLLYTYNPETDTWTIYSGNKAELTIAPPIEVASAGYSEEIYSR